MLVTIDNINKNIKISSIARDTYVDIPGYSKEKLTNAYAYGGIYLLREVFQLKRYITGHGTQRLKGYQALAFSRIRYTDSSYARENRNREVAQSVYKEFLNSATKEYQRAAQILLDNTKTNIASMEMINLGFTDLKINDKSIAQFQLPLADHKNGHIISKRTGWVIERDKDPNLTDWHNFINETTEE